MSAEDIDHHLDLERSASYWQLCGVVESLITLYRKDQSAAFDRIEQLKNQEVRALLSLVIHRVVYGEETW